jgi:dTDP-4-amino-4,6-dideoxygalactose transaminase
MPEERILLSPPSLDSRDKEALSLAFDSGWIAPLGPEVDAFENSIAQYLSVQNAVALSSGTAALHLSLLAIGVKPGDSVVLPTLTFAATAFAVKYVGARPIFIDSELSSWTIDTCLLESYLETETTKPKAIISVDLFGRPCDFDELNRISLKFGIPLISDSAESLGSKFKNDHVGSQALITVFSFNGNKIISTSGGGMLVTNNFEIASKIRYLATQARDKVHWYEHSEIGFNYRLSNLLAAIGNSQLARLDETIQKRKAIQERYSSNFQHIDTLEVVNNPRWGVSNYWLTNIRITSDDFPEAREAIRRLLDSRNIESRYVWKPMHKQPIFLESEGCLNGTADKIYDSALCLPTGTSLTLSEVDLISELVLAAMTQQGI